eukprot:CAMPEP_0177661086 /NCGR_PEP_ID=MMETSP0447-20121125/18450_1 /TAXON_ID=0 /ORGANISM="Stygamoeba regulata, Strain BSH-02190019" /LENGTH=374 /DNA_ID=CAMNT_0019166323 /DNA_START=15 /DNA_END=1139 /DNA_ORIENTATION=-
MAAPYDDDLALAIALSASNVPPSDRDTLRSSLEVAFDPDCGLEDEDDPVDLAAFEEECEQALSEAQQTEPAHPGGETTLVPSGATTVDPSISLTCEIIPDEASDAAAAVLLRNRSLLAAKDRAELDEVIATMMSVSDAERARAVPHPNSPEAVRFHTERQQMREREEQRRKKKESNSKKHPKETGQHIEKSKVSKRDRVFGLLVGASPEMLARERDYRRHRARLQERLDFYGLAQYPIRSDGNCQFRAISDQLYQNTRMHMVLRRLAVQQLVNEAHHYRRFVPFSYEVYCSEMSMRSTWGDHITLQALADVIPMQINVVTSSGDATITEIHPVAKKPERVVWLALLSECHYTSLYPRDRLKQRQRQDASKCLIM